MIMWMGEVTKLLEISKLCMLTSKDLPDVARRVDGTLLGGGCYEFFAGPDLTIWYVKWKGKPYFLVNWAMLDLIASVGLLLRVIADLATTRKHV